MAKDLVENPPKYGPRTTPKAAPANPVDQPTPDQSTQEPAQTGSSCPGIVPFNFHGDALDVVRIPDGMSASCFGGSARLWGSIPTVSSSGFVGLKHSALAGQARS